MTDMVLQETNGLQGLTIPERNSHLAIDPVPTIPEATDQTLITLLEIDLIPTTHPEKEITHLGKDLIRTISQRTGRLPTTRPETDIVPNFLAPKDLLPITDTEIDHLPTTDLVATARTVTAKDILHETTYLSLLETDQITLREMIDHLVAASHPTTDLPISLQANVTILQTIFTAMTFRLRQISTEATGHLLTTQGVKDHPLGSSVEDPHVSLGATDHPCTRTFPAEEESGRGSNPASAAVDHPSWSEGG